MDAPATTAPAARRGAGLRAAMGSAGWLASEKLLRLVLAVAVGVWVARHLGPQAYGQLSLALSWVALLGCCAWFGVGDTVTRAMVRDRSDEGRLLGSAFLLRCLGTALSLAALGGALAAGLIPAELAPLVLVLAWMLPAGELTGGIWLWFQSHLRMGRAVMVKNVALLAGSLARLGVIAAGGGALAMAWTFVGEAAVVGLGLLLTYRLAGQRLRQWRFDIRHARSLFVLSLPVLLSVMVATLNTRLDQLLLGALVGTQEVGVYAAAVRFSEIWWQVPVLLMQSLAPGFLFAPGLRPARVERNVGWLMLALAGAALLPCLLLSVLGGNITGPLLGPAFAGSQAVLAVHIWIALFLFVDTAQNQWLLARGQQSVLISKSLSSLSVNGALGLLLVPTWGAVGAAVAALAAQVWAALFFCWAFPSQQGLRALQRRAARSLWRAPRVLRWLSRRRQTSVTEAA